MDEFKTNIFNALMKQSLTSIDNCLNNKRNYNLKIQMKQKSLSSNFVNSGGEPLAEYFHLAIRHEFHLSSVNQVLDLVFQRPTVIGVMSRTMGVVYTKCVGVIARSRGIGLPNRIL